MKLSEIILTFVYITLLICTVWAIWKAFSIRTKRNNVKKLIFPRGAFSEEEKKALVIFENLDKAFGLEALVLLPVANIINPKGLIELYNTNYGDYQRMFNDLQERCET